MNTQNTQTIKSIFEAKVGFIGAGNMAQAIISGLIKAGKAADSIYCSNPTKAKLDILSHNFPQIHTSNSNSDIASSVDVLVIAVKPQKMTQALGSIKTLNLTETLIVSVAAGIETATICHLLAQTLPVVRAMPNTPSTLGVGATGLFANQLVSDPQRTLAKQIFDSVGTSVWITEESQMDLVTAISGSGPAHYFYFMEAVIASAVEQGMAPEVAKLLASQTALGAAKMVISDSDNDIASLRAKVTSPGGTTAAAIESLEKSNLHSIINAAINSSVKRGQQLAKLDIEK